LLYLGLFALVLVVVVVDDDDDVGRKVLAIM